MAGLSIRSLRVFDAIILNGTLGAAARQLNTSVSAASRQLLELERDIGMSLFERTNRALLPTEAGLRFHAEVQYILNGLNELPAIVETIRREERETLNVVCMPRLAQGLLAPTQRIFAERAPQTRVISSVLRRHDIQRWAASRSFDIGIGMLPVRHSALTATALANVRATLLLRDDHPLAGQEQVDLHDLADATVIGYPKGLMVRDQIDALFGSEKIAPSFVTETSSTMLACQLSAEGVGAAIVDVVAASPFLSNPRMKLVPILPERSWQIGYFVQKRANNQQSISKPFIVALRAAIGAIERETDRALLVSTL